MWRWASPVPGTWRSGGVSWPTWAGWAGWAGWAAVGPVGGHSSGPQGLDQGRTGPSPAGIIGKTFCSSAISNQMKAGPSTDWAKRMAGSTSSGLRRLDGGDPERVGELQVVGALEVRGVVVAPVDDLLPLPDHAQLLVVEERDLHRDPVGGQGHQLLAGHLEAAVAADRPGLGVRVAQGRAHRGRDREAHRAQAARADVAVGPAELRVARQPHLVLAHVRDVGGNVVGQARRCARRHSRRSGRRSAAPPEPCQDDASDSLRHALSWAK